MDPRFTVHEAKELVLEMLHSIVYTVQDLFTTLQKEVNDVAHSIEDGNWEVFCAVSLLCASMTRIAAQSNSHELKILVGYSSPLLIQQFLTSIRMNSGRAWNPPQRTF